MINHISVFLNNENGFCCENVILSVCEFVSDMWYCSRMMLC